MRRKKNYVRRLAGLVGCLLMTACLCFSSVDGTVLAAEGIPAYRIAIDNPSTALGMVETGSSQSGSFKVSNDGTEPFRFKISFAPMSITGDNYDHDFTSETQYTDIANWISTDIEEGELEPGKSQKITWTVDVPADAHGGGQSGAVLVTMDPIEETDGGVVASRQLAHIILANVNGDIIRTANIIENSVPSFLFNPPIYASSVVENTGNVYTNVKYTLQVFPLFSDEEVFTNEEKPENNVILPETKRLNQISWDGAPQLGIFKVRSVVKIFDEESVVEKMVFLCPIWFLFIVILAIILIVVWIVSRAIKRKKEA